MNDDEFLDYCASHADTPRCGFVPAHIARLARLAGNESAAEHWDTQPHGVYDMDRWDIWATVKEARSRLTPTRPAGDGDARREGS